MSDVLDFQNQDLQALELAMISYFADDDQGLAAARSLVGQDAASAQKALKLVADVGLRNFAEVSESITPAYMLTALGEAADNGFINQVDVRRLRENFRELGFED
jgi:hypothetical protein